MVKLSQAEKFKQVFKEALTETIQEQRAFLRDIIARQLKMLLLPRQFARAGKLRRQRGQKFYGSSRETHENDFPRGAKLSAKQAKYIGVKVEGPLKAETYRY